MIVSFVSVLSTLGELSLAISPVIITALATRSPAALWVSLTAATLLAASVARPSAAEA
jgi:hypothetical protein